MGTTAKTDRSENAELNRDRQNSQSQEQFQQGQQPRDGRAESAKYIQNPARSGTMDRSNGDNGDNQRREEQPVGSSARSYARLLADKKGRGLQSPAFSVCPCAHGGTPEVRAL